MKKKPLITLRHFETKMIEDCSSRTVPKFGNCAKTDCSKEHVGRTPHIVVV